MSNPSRPSLYSGAVPPHSNIESTSILDALEPRRARWKFRRRVMLFGFLAVGAIAAFFVTQTPMRGYLDSWKEELGLTSISHVLPAPSEESATLSSNVSPQTAAGSGAKIVNTSVPLADEQTVVIQEQWGNDPLAILLANENEESNDAGLIGETGMLAAPALLAKEKPASAPKKQSKTNGSAARSHVRTQKPSPSTQNTGSDKDVALIAALLSRVSPSANEKGDERKKNISLKKNSAGEKKGRNEKSAATHAERLDEKNRDIVVRTAGDTTESLIQRCRALGFFEGELCRLRICSGLWGQDPACPTGEN